DPRPLSGAFQGVFAFYGVTALWRGLTRTGDDRLARRSAFEFAYWRAQTGFVLDALRRDAQLTAAGRRFLDGVAEVFQPWRSEPISADVRELAAAAPHEHRARRPIPHL